MVTLYSKQDMESMEENIDAVILKAIRQQLDLLEPSIEEYKKVYNLVINFIKNNNLIIHGNFAIDTLIKQKNKDDGYFLKIEDDILLNPNRPSDYPIINVYSTDPYYTMKMLCDELVLHNLDFVEGKSSGRVNGNYLVMVNFINYLCIDYIPLNIYEKVWTITIDNIKYLDPKLILINNLKIYTSLLINNKLLEEHVLTTNKILKYYPLKFNKLDMIKYTLTSEMNNALEYIRKHILPNSDLINTGYYAYYYFLYKGLDDIKQNLFIPTYEVHSINFRNDVENITKKLREHNDMIRVKEFYPFFHYQGESVQYFINNHCILRIYNQDDNCLQYRSILKKKTFVSSYQSFIMSCLINYFKFHIQNNNNEINNYQYMMNDIISIRNKYLDNNNKTLLDDTPFQEFNVECKGQTQTSDRKFRLYVREKIKNREAFIIKYDPENIKKYPDKMYKLNDISGLEKK